MLDENRELQLAAALNLPRVRRLGGKNAQRDVADELRPEPRLDERGGDLVAVQPREGRGVDADRHRERRLVDRDHGQRARVVRVRKGLADRHFGDAGDGDDLTGPCLFRFHAVECLGHVQLRHLRSLDGPVGAAPRDLLGAPDRSLENPAESESAHVRRGIEVRDERLQRVALVVGRGGDALEDQIKQRLEVLLERVRVWIERRASRLGIAIDDRELDLGLVRIEVEEQLVDLVDDGLDTRIRAIDLVHHEDHRQSRFERLSKHEPRLRKRPLARVHE